MKKTKLFIGPVSKNVVDATINHANRNDIYLGLTPTRRQIDWNQGYVNKWFTDTFAEYVRKESDYIILGRNHGGPGQGNILDNGLESIGDDCKYGFDIIHVDPWLKFPDYKNGVMKTIDGLNHAYKQSIRHQNRPVWFEIGTEEAIRKFEPKELTQFIDFLKVTLRPEVYDRIKYVVVQSGTRLDLVNKNNTGKYDRDRLKEVADIIHGYGFLTKEHNGDFLNQDQIRTRFNNGLDAINIAPEFGMIETDVILNNIGTDKKLFNKFFWLCYESGRWNKWVNKSFNPIKQKQKLIRLCGHYVFSHPEFADIKKVLDPDIDELIKIQIKQRIREIENAVE